jgi:dGTP triphosphohydrolase
MAQASSKPIRVASFLQVRRMVLQKDGQTLNLLTDSDAGVKKSCDASIANSAQIRDEVAARSEVLEVNLEKLATEQRALNQEVKDLATDIAEMKESLSQATALRSMEQAQNKAAEVMAKEAKASTGVALHVLTEFFKSVAPKGSSKALKVAGQNVFKNEYKSALAKSAVAVSMLETMAGDFDRAAIEVEEDEQAGQKKLHSLKTEYAKVVETMLDSRMMKESQLSEIQGRIHDVDGELRDQQSRYKSAVAALAHLKVKCTDEHSAL